MPAAYAAFGTARESNERYHEPVGDGTGGMSVAFAAPRLRATGERANCALRDARGPIHATRDVLMGDLNMSTLESLGMSRAEFERGQTEGLQLAHAGRPLPHLRGGAYAVGLLFGYRSAGRPRAVAFSRRQLAG